MSSSFLTSSIIMETPTQTLQESTPPPSAVIFIDEIDALAKSRSGSSFGGSFSGANDEREQTLNQLLTEMDGFHSASSTNPKVSIVVFAATNRPDVLDPALLRPGRFDRHVHVGLPNKEGREAIFKLHASKIRVVNDSHAKKVRWDELAADKLTHGFSGAEIENVVNEAAFLAIRQNDEYVYHDHFFASIQKISKMKLSALQRVL